LFQDDNFSLSLLNELSVKYGIQTHLSHAPLPQKLEELREYIRREIKKELKVSFSFQYISYEKKYYLTCKRGKASIVEK
jgi:hypothetical protein